MKTCQGRFSADSLGIIFFGPVFADSLVRAKSNQPLKRKNIV
ncbi:hypothetical protein CHISP_1744 [Chitinispirillum alkaliphilum]|nr:hypothetical protein CHISP_1744 [Chitinispirillum alkaliphilum]